MELIDKILTEWSYRVHDGMPNPKNPLHIVQLKESMEHLNIDKEVRELVITNLMEQKFYARSKKSNRIVDFDTEESKDAAIKAGTHEKVSPEEVEKEKGETGEEEPPEQQTTPKVDGGQSNPYDKETDETDEKETKVDINNLSDEELKDLDHSTTKNQLEISTI